MSEIASRNKRRSKAPASKRAQAEKNAGTNTKKKQTSNNITTSKPLSRASVKAPFPKDVQPMLATLVDKPFDEPGWNYEIKWDGYRAIAYIRNHTVQLISRNNKYA